MNATKDASELDNALLEKMHAYWRACNYLAAGMIYLQDNPLLRTRLKPDHIKNRLLGHWGASPGLSFTYIHMNRLNQAIRSECHFPGRARSWRTGCVGPGLPGRHVLGSLSQ